MIYNYTMILPFFLRASWCAVLMQQIVRSAGKGEGPQVVMVLTHLTATQPHLSELPKSVLKVCHFPRLAACTTAHCLPWI